MKVKDGRNGGTVWVAVFIGLLCLVMTAGTGVAQPPLFVYTNNNIDISGSNSASAFSVNRATGALTPIAGMPFMTGSRGGGLCNFMDSAAVDPLNRLLFITNGAGNTLSAFRIQTDGSLIQTPGSPIATGGTLPIGVINDPLGRFVFAANHNSGTVSVFSIAGNGSLTPVSGSPFPASSGCWTLEAHPSGNFLYAVSRSSGDRIHAYHIASTGQLSELSGSPYTGPLNSHGSEISRDGQFLFVQSFSGGSCVIVFAMNQVTGQLTQVAGSPFSVNMSTGMGITPDGSLLYGRNGSNNNLINALSVSGAGTLAHISGSPFANSPGATNPGGFVVAPDGKYLFAVNQSSTHVSSFAIAPNGALSSAPGSPFNKVHGGCSHGIAYFELFDLDITPFAQEVVGPEGGPFVPDTLAYTLTNHSAAPLDWTAAKTANWLDDPVPASGTLAAGASAPVTVGINANAEALTPGEYVDSLVFTDVTSGMADNRPISLTVWTIPDVTMEQAPTQPDPTATLPIMFDVAFSEAVTGFDDNTLPGGDVTFAGTATVDAFIIIPDGRPAPDSIDYDILNTCGSGDIYTFYLNGGVLGTTTSNLAGQCQCAAPLQTYTISDSGLIASLWLAGQPNTFRVTKVNTATLFAWVRARMHFGGATETLCIYDYNGGDCTVLDLCAAGYSNADFDQQADTPAYMDPSRYTIEVTAVSAEGTVVPEIPAGAAQSVNGVDNRPSTSVDNSVYYDMTPPEVLSVTCADTNPTNAAQVDFLVTFTEPVSGIAVSDFALTASGVTGASVVAVDPVAGVSCTVTINTGTGDGTLRLDVVDDDSIVDAVGFPLGGAGAGNGDFTDGEHYVIDKTGPTGTISVNGGDVYTTDMAVQLSLSADDGAGVGVADMRFSNDGLSWSDWEAYAATAAWALETGDGLKTVHAEYRDGLGNVSTDAISDSITLDTTPPDPPVVTGPEYTNAPQPTWTWSAGGGGNGTYQYELNASGVWVETTDAFFTPDDALDDGAHTLRVQERDDAGNWSASGSHTLTINTTPLEAVLERSGPAETGADSVSFTVSFNRETAPSFDASAVSVAGTLTGTVIVSGTDPDYVVTVTLADPDADGTVGIAVAGGVVEDAFGNVYAGGASPLYQIWNWREPWFTEEPAGARKYTGDSHTLSAAANCDASSMSYQWKWEDGAKTEHLGPTTQSWALTELTPAHAGAYWCEANYDGATHATAPAILEVEPPLEITAQPEGGPKAVGDSHEFAVAVNGGYMPLAYQWRKDEAVIPDAPDAAVYPLTDLEESDSGSYDVVVTDDNGASVVSDTAVLLVGTDLPAMNALLLAALVLALALGALRAATLSRLPKSHRG